MNNQEAIKNLEKLKEYFNSSMFENSQSMIDTMDIAIKSLQCESELTKTAGFNKTPFDRVDIHNIYYHITALGGISSTVEHTDYYDDKRFSNYNYFNDKNFANQVALHQLLYRKLLKFKLQRETKSKNLQYCYVINIGQNDELYIAEIFLSERNCNGIYFEERAIAELALKKLYYLS